MNFSEEGLTLNLRVLNKSCNFAVLIFTKIYSTVAFLLYICKGGRYLEYSRFVVYSYRGGSRG